MSTLDVTITSDTTASATWPHGGVPAEISADNRRELMQKIEDFSVNEARTRGMPVAVTITRAGRQAFVTAHPDGKTEKAAPTTPIPVVSPSDHADGAGAVEPSPATPVARADDSDVIEPVMVAAPPIAYAPDSTPTASDPGPADGPERIAEPGPIATPSLAPAQPTTAAAQSSTALVRAPAMVPAVRAVPTLAAPQITPAATGPAQMGWRGRLNAALHLGLPPKGESPEMRLRTAAATITCPLQSFARVTVANLKGGVGKTPEAVALASTFATHRGAGTVVLADLAEVGGSLAHRVAVPPRADLNVLKLLDAADTIRARPAALSQFLTRQPGGEDVIVGYQGLTGQTLELEQVELLGELLAPHREMLVADTGNNGLSGAWQWAVANSSALVVPVPLRRDAAVGAQQMLADIALIDSAAMSRTLVIVTDGPGDAPLIETEVVDAFLALDVAKVLRMPYEPLFASGERIVPSQLQPTTTESMTVIAAAVVEVILATDNR
ncbi:ParA family protein [Nocardia tengchongensis]|uniref:ParA family protein n=1 Tax=Nocardia tengchongensis TaxID=2055889 RepID=UPI00365B8946